MIIIRAKFKSPVSVISDNIRLIRSFNGKRWRVITKWSAGHRSREGSLANQQPEHTERAFLQQNGTKSTVFRPTQLLLEHQSTNSRPTYTGCAWEVRMTRAETVHCTTTFFKTPQPQDNITDAQSTAALSGAEVPNTCENAKRILLSQQKNENTRRKLQLGRQIPKLHEKITQNCIIKSVNEPNCTGLFSCHMFTAAMFTVAQPPFLGRFQTSLYYLRLPCE